VPPQRNCLVKTIFFEWQVLFCILFWRYLYCSDLIKVTLCLTLALVGTVVIVSCANWVSLWPSKKQRFGVCADAISDINRSAAFYSLHCSCRLLLSPSPWSLLLSPPGHALTWSTVDVLLHIQLSPSLLYFFAASHLDSFSSCGTDLKDKETMDRFRIPSRLIQHGPASAVVVTGCATTSERWWTTRCCSVFPCFRYCWESV